MVTATEIRQKAEASKAQKREPVTVPEWDGVTVFVKSLSAKERDEWEYSCIERQEQGKDVYYANVRARLVARCLVDEAGALIFPGDNGADALGELDGAPVVRLWEAARRVNKLNAEDVETMEKNSASAPSEPSP